MSYIPQTTILEKYARVLIHWALHGGKGAQKNEVVLLNVPECAKPMLLPLQQAVLEAGAHPIINFIPDEIMRPFYDHATDEQRLFFPHALMKGRIDQVDHIVSLIAETNKHEFEGVDPKKIMSRSKAFRQYQEWKDDKETQGALTWTLALYGTEAMAKEANLTLEQYWKQIIEACFLDKDNPIEHWRNAFTEVERVRTKLNDLAIESVRVRAPETDLTIGLGPGRRWLGGSGRNVPSFEVFISPDARVTEGHIRCNQPLYRYGNLIKDIRLEFKRGRVVRAEASYGQHVLQEMIATKGADRIGEFSLTDKRLSRISTFMAETLFDENIGGAYGNTHIALGNAYKDSYPGDARKLTKEDWAAMGYNESVVHTDIISTEDRTVTALLEDGTELVIYQDGQFTI